MDLTSNVALVGYRGTGKSTIARLLAKQLDRDWVDLDDLIESAANQSIKEIFSQEGESAFRDLEETVFAKAMLSRQTVIATGGGLILRPANRKLLEQGLVIWLTASPAVLFQRIYSDPASTQRRPDLTASGGLAEIEDVLREREPLYRAVCDIPIETEGKTPDQIVTEIVSLLSA